MCTSFAVEPQTAKVMAMVGGKCLFKMEKAGNLGLQSSRGVLECIPRGKGDACVYPIVSGPPHSSPVFPSTLELITLLPS